MRSAGAARPRPADAEFLHAITQGAGLEAKDGGGATLAFDDPVRLLKHVADVRGRDVVQRAEIHRLRTDRR